ncbi:MAG: hypothetical protein AAF721_13750, partial [Myxococcota bacterium]
PPAPLSAELLDWLAAAAVTEENFARGVLYSWTSDATAKRMQRDRALFDDNVLPEGPTPYVQRLQHHASLDHAGGRLAKALLGHPDLMRRRYAWARPWPTRLGLVREYGGHLIAVRLQPGAVIGRFDPDASPAWTFRDLDQRAVPLARVAANPSMVAAVLHVRRDATPHFREYVLCNESMVAQWSVDDPSNAAELERDAARLRALASADARAIPDSYRDALAVEVPHYDPTPDNLAAVAEALVTRPDPLPLQVRTRKRFRHKAAPELVQVRQVPPRLEVLI